LTSIGAIGGECYAPAPLKSQRAHPEYIIIYLLRTYTIHIKTQKKIF